MKVAQRMIHRQEGLSGVLITTDPLYAQRETTQDLVELGGYFLFQIKVNQKKVREQAALRTETPAPPLPAAK